VDVTDVQDADDPDAAMREHLERDAAAPFDLERGPLWRASLVRLSPERHAFALTMHHVVTDGWSMGVLVRELSALYDAHARREPAALPALPIQYADYAAWQRDWLAGGELKRQLGYWTELLAGRP
jgi:NRPS condensation-like uncharacterized protein